MIKYYWLWLVLLLIPTPAQAANPTLTILSPAPYQVFQRYSGEGDILLAGFVTNAPSYTVEVSTDNLTWDTILSNDTPFFQAFLRRPEGQYTLYVRLSGLPTTSVNVAYVGIGDVFVTAGQSNSSGRGARNQVYTHPTLKAGLFANNYTWRELRDPTDSATGQIDMVSRDDARGSIWPLLATLFMAEENVPIAFIPCAAGNTTIAQWQPTAPDDRNTLYGSCRNRISKAAIGGIKAVLWIQGEADVKIQTSALVYADNLRTLAAAFYADFNAPLMPALLHTLRSSGVSLEWQWQIRYGIELAPSIPDSHIILGADLSTITADDASSQHFTTNASLQQAADLWWAVLDSTFYGG